MNEIKLLDAEEEKKVEDSIVEWFQNVLPELRKNSHFKFGVAEAKIKVFQCSSNRLDFRLIFQFFSLTILSNKYFKFFLKLSKDEIDVDELFVFHQGYFYNKNCFINQHQHHQRDQICFRCRILRFLETAMKFIFWCVICVAVGLWFSTLTNDGENENFIKNCQTPTSIHFDYWLCHSWLVFLIKWNYKFTVDWIFSI